MSQFFSKNLQGIKPYVPGEQPQDKKYIKLNTNESPYPPAEGVIKAVRDQSELLNLYSDPDGLPLKRAAAQLYGLSAENVSFGNGSDEILAHVFRAFLADKNTKRCRSFQILRQTWKITKILTAQCALQTPTRRREYIFSRNRLKC